MSDAYRVHLDRFDGPLDLLLHLIRRAEVDIQDIPIATIADQFVAQLSDLERIDIDRAGEFLVMAATLAEIKSRVLARAPGKDTGEDDAADPRDENDPRSDLIRQLLEYKTFRDAADELERRGEDWSRRYPAARAGIDSAEVRAAVQRLHEGVELEDIALGDLIEAFERIYQSVNFERLGEHEVSDDDTPIELHAEDIIDQVKRLTASHAGATMPLRRIFEGRTRAEMLGLFLATLELTRQRRIDVRQDDATGEITLELREVGEGASDEPSGEGSDAIATSGSRELGIDARA